MSRNYVKFWKRARIAGNEKLTLPENVAKGGLSIGIIQGFNGLEDETEELRLEVTEYKTLVNSGPTLDELVDRGGKDYLIKLLKKIRHEAADCLNFAAMIISKCDDLLKKYDEI